jgi:spermidine/putrescine transport system permease protein
VSPASTPRIAWASVTPALLWTLVFFVVPFIAMGAMSLSTKDGGWSLAAYSQFFTNESYWRALVNSLEVTLIVTFFSVLLAYPFAWILAFLVPERWQRLALMLAVLPFWTSYVVRS